MAEQKEQRAGRDQESEESIARANYARYQYGMDTGHRKYIEAARLNEDMYLGGGIQWREADRKKRNAAKLPMVELNHILPAINTATGQQLHSRVDMNFLPRGEGADEASATLTVLAGQKAAVRRARKSVSNFKLRQGQPIGAMVTLRGVRMYEFLDRLISLAIPRMRDFRGVPDRAFDGHGNYTLGIKDQLIFPEVEYNKITRAMGMNVTIGTTAKTDPEAKALLGHFGMPFRK